MTRTVTQRSLRPEVFPTSAATAFRNAVEPRLPWRRSSFACAMAWLITFNTVSRPRAGGGRATGICGAVPSPSTMSTGPPGPSMMRSPSRTGTGSVTRSSFTKVPFFDPASPNIRDPDGATVSSACTRDTTGSPRAPGAVWTSHSADRPIRIRVPRAS